MQIILLGGPLLPCAVPVCDRVPGVRASSPQAAKMAALPGRGRASGPRRGLPDRSLGGSCHNMHHPSQEGIKNHPLLLSTDFLAHRVGQEVDTLS